MDFVERLFHVSPDGGSGTFEAAFLVVAVGMGLLLARARAVIPSRFARKPSQTPEGAGR